MGIHILAVMVVLGAPSRGAPPDADIELAEVRRKMTELLEHLPDYNCVVTMQRATKSSRGREFKPTDAARYEIAYSNGRELFAWTGADRFEERSLREAFPLGVVSSGEFALHARAVFQDGFTVFSYAGSDAIDGSTGIRWDFEIPLFGSGWRISHGGGSVVVGARGSFWVHPTTTELMRLEMKAEGIPPGFPNTSAVARVDYGTVQIGGLPVLLPQSASLTLGEISGSQNRNLFEFSHCRQYVAESTLTFDSPAPVDAATKLTLPKKPLALASGINIRVSLSNPIDAATAAAGDPVRAVVAADAVQRGRVVVPRGSAVRGRIRRIEKRDGPPEQIDVGLELTDVALPEGSARFFSELQRLENPGAGQRIAARSSLEILGVGTILTGPPAFRLAEGLTMVWEIKDAGRRREYRLHGPANDARPWPDE